jgi:hypothetical protein
MYIIILQSLFSFVIGQNASDNYLYLEVVALFHLLTPSACNYSFFLDRSSVQKKYYCTLWLPSPGAVHCLLKSARKFHIFKSVNKTALPSF